MSIYLYLVPLASISTSTLYLESFTVHLCSVRGFILVVLVSQVLISHAGHGVFSKPACCGVLLIDQLMLLVAGCLIESAFGLFVECFGTCVFDCLVSFIIFRLHGS